MSPNEVDDIMKGIYPKSYGKFAGVQVVIFRVKAAGKSLMWIEYALNDCPFPEAFRNPFPDDETRRYMDDHVSIGTAIRFTLRGCGWIPG